MSRTMIWVLAWALPMLCSGALAQDKPATDAVAADASADPKYLQQSNAQREQVQPGNNAPVWRQVGQGTTGFSLALVFLAPPALAIAGEGNARLAGLLGWAGMAASFLPTLHRYGRSRAWAPFLPLVAGYYTLATIASAWRYWRGKGGQWKGRAQAENVKHAKGRGDAKGAA